MKILLDTHILLWTLTGDSKLSPKAASIINDKKNAVFYSIISIWETAIKNLKNPAKLNVSYHDLVNFCKESRFNYLTKNRKNSPTSISGR